MSKLKELAAEILSGIEPIREVVRPVARDPQEHVDYQPNVDYILKVAAQVDIRFGGTLDEEITTRGSGASRILHVGLNVEKFVPVVDFELTTKLSVQHTIGVGQLSFTKDEVVKKIRTGLESLT